MFAALVLIFYGVFLPLLFWKGAGYAYFGLVTAFALVSLARLSLSLFNVKGKYLRGPERVSLESTIVLIYFGVFLPLYFLKGALSAFLALMPAFIVAGLAWLALSVFRKPERVSFDEERVITTFSNGGTQSIKWVDLQEVMIVTTDKGPWMEDVYWLLTGNQGGCAFSGGAEGIQELLDRLLRLPGFDYATVIKAMGSTDNARFICWKRDPAEPEALAQPG